MAATIALLANKGELVDAERKVGRANDRDVGGIDKTGIRLEHRDNFGRLLNPKEAFRQLSYKFHGKQPGRKKQAKILQAYQDELDAKRTGHGGTMSEEGVPSPGAGSSPGLSCPGDPTVANSAGHNTVANCC